MSHPKVSVIVLNYNNLKYMDDCFSSLSQLDYPTDCLELILADNGSSDGSVDHVRERFPTVRVIQFDQNLGFGAGNNRAAEQTESEYVAFLNSDMRVAPGWLAGLVDALGDEPDAVCSGSKILSWDGQSLDFAGTLLSFLGHASANGYQDQDLAKYDGMRYLLAACGGAMLIDRRVFMEAGGFDPDFGAYFEDVDLGWRLWSMGYKVVFAPRSICYHVHFGTSSSLPPAKVQYLYERNALYTIIKNYEPQYLERVLPLALLMQFKRAYLHAQLADLDMERCRFDPTKLEQPDAEPEPEYNTRYYLRQAWQTLRAGGLPALAHKILEERERRRAQPAPDELLAQRSLFGWMEQAGIAAANDVVESYCGILQKRAHIQARRRRTDQEIFSTVQALSFGVCVDTPEYRQAQQRLMTLFDIENLFGELFDPDIPFTIAPHPLSINDRQAK